MKLLFLSEAVSLAHIGRPLLLAKWAKSIGAEVHFAASPKGLEKAHSENIGLKTHNLFTIDEKIFYKRVHHCNFFYSHEELKRYVDQERNLIQQIEPDLIISDFRLTSAISAELSDKPLLNLSNAYWCPAYSCQFLPPESGLFNVLPFKTTNILFNFIRPYFFKFFGRELNQTREYYGLKRKNDFRELYTDGTYTAYLDHPNFVKINKLPANHFFLGPVIWSPASDKLKENLNSNYVYLSMGSTGNNHLLPLIINIVLKKRLNLIISGANALEKRRLIKQFPHLEHRAIIEPLIPAQDVLPFCQLTICHGGSGTVYQSLESGVPIVCFPQNPDQSLVSLSVLQNNLGRFLTNKQAKPKEIEKVIQECMASDVIHQNSKLFQSLIKEWDTKNHWIQFLDKFENNRHKITA